MIKLNNHKSLVSIDGIIHLEAKRYKLANDRYSCHDNELRIKYKSGESVSIFYRKDEHYYDESSEASAKMVLDFKQLEELLLEGK